MTFPQGDIDNIDVMIFLKFKQIYDIPTGRYCQYRCHIYSKRMY